jgi:hypothetical protein
MPAYRKKTLQGRLESKTRRKPSQAPHLHAVAPARREGL